MSAQGRVDVGLGLGKNWIKGGQKTLTIMLNCDILTLVLPGSKGMHIWSVRSSWPFVAESI
jgi:hypothetical protein